ncbi:hypothetical protein PTKIN_Ptkin03bG0000200 [Pterospermum kingtungense]
MVGTPVGNFMICEHVYRDCMVKIGDYELLMDFIPMLLQDFDAIVGMDGLSRYHAIVDCYNKTVVFEPSGKSKFIFQGERCFLPSCVISAITTKKLLQKGCQAYLAYVVDTKMPEPTLKNILVVCEYPDVFPEELSGLPPDREIEFTIELNPGTTPISQAPYRMASVELKELKV